MASNTPPPSNHSTPRRSLDPNSDMPVSPTTSAKHSHPLAKNTTDIEAGSSGSEFEDTVEVQGEGTDEQMSEEEEEEEDIVEPEAGQEGIRDVMLDVEGSISDRPEEASTGELAGKVDEIHRAERSSWKVKKAKVCQVELSS